jgi:SpoVK/Ycf46/Vps4 family AAA+-type ATPase
MLAKASSNTLKATFFEARASVLLSKYFGESGKLISALFSKARKSQPCLVFVDEVDSMASARRGDTNDASRRVLSEFLQQMDGFNTRKEEKVLIMAATNKPWDLDDAIVSRFQRKIYIPMPDIEARKSILKIHLKGVQLSGTDVDALAQSTDFYSGRDIMNLCGAAIMGMVQEQNPELYELDDARVENYKIRTRPLTQKDFDTAMEKVRPSVSLEDLDRFKDWEKNLN